MAKAIIITIAGESKRFRASIKQDVLKALYKKENEPCVLDILLNYASEEFEDIITVGGYNFTQLNQYIQAIYPQISITLVFNSHFSQGSNESLLCGIRALKKSYEEVIFIEGDLIIDKNSFKTIVNNQHNVITYTTEPITAKSSVLYYINAHNKIIYKYDTKHALLEIQEPFKAISNSGQVWKFTDCVLLKEVCASFAQKDLHETNLATIDAYFSKVAYENIAFIKIEQWYNCNTIHDYEKGIAHAHYK
jgi:CTP:molybdopterin cytidylyltransferase MocA